MKGVMSWYNNFPRLDFGGELPCYWARDIRAEGRDDFGFESDWTETDGKACKYKYLYNSQIIG